MSKAQFRFFLLSYAAAADADAVKRLSIARVFFSYHYVKPSDVCDVNSLCRLKTIKLKSCTVYECERVFFSPYS